MYPFWIFALARALLCSAYDSVAGAQVDSGGDIAFGTY